MDKVKKGLGRGLSSLIGEIKVESKKNEDKKFKIGTGFTANMRKQMWKNKENMVGKVVTFGYKGLTGKGIPRHPAFMRMRVNADT